MTEWASGVRALLRRLVASCAVLAAPALPACGDAASGAASGAAPSAAAPAAAPADDAAFEAARLKAVSLQDAGGDHTKTLEALLAAHALRPDHYGINHRLGRFYSDQKLHEAALPYFEAAFAARPDELSTLLTIVTLQVRLGREDAALANLPRLEQDHQFRGEARYQRALILDQRGRRDEVRALVQDVEGLTPAEAYRCRSLHARLLLEDGDFAGARTLFRAALAGRPDYKEALKGMADCSRRLGEDAEAERWDALLDGFLELTDNVYMQTPKARPERRAVLEQLLASYPEWTAGYPELADLQVALGDKPAACRTIEAFLAAHGAGVAPATAAGLRARYCGSPP